MEELFKSLSESVSEECFEDIMNMVEDVLSQIKKVHGEPEWDEENGKPKNKSAVLTQKAKDNKDKEGFKEIKYSKYTPKILKKAEDATVIWATDKNRAKNEAGKEFTDERRKGFPTKKLLNL